MSFAVIYRWRVVPGGEEQFVDGWHRVTAAVLERCGSFGSRLHRSDDGTWVAYARWPSEEARRRCFAGPPLDPDASRMMREAVAETFPEVRLTLVDDLLREDARPGA